MWPSLLARGLRRVPQVSELGIAALLVACSPGTAAIETTGSAASGGNGSGGLGSGGNRWPREETLALIRIRSEMDATFRDATLKGPLWEEVSRYDSPREKLY